MRKCIFAGLLLFSVHAYPQQAFVFEKTPSLPELMPADWINTGLYERDFALSPDGTELFYTLQVTESRFQTILHSTKDAKGNWSKPEVASFAGNYSDLEPAFTQDGKKLFFVSNRPLSGTAAKDFDIWVIEKENGKWGIPKNLGAPVNTAGDEFYPAVAANGNLYYTATYKNGIGKEDIFMAAWNDGQYKEPVPLDTAVNSATYEFNAFVSPDESFIIFTSYGRKDDKGGGDLYMSSKDASGKWQPAKNLVFLNSAKLDFCPFVSFDKKVLFFTSQRSNLPRTYTEKPVKLKELQTISTSPKNGSGDIYWVSFDKVMESIK